MSYAEPSTVLEECKQQLRSSKIEMAEKVEVGAMVEIPSAAICASALAREVDFFSIGTNDLIQYALAVDRVNEKVAYLYEPTHPAILRLLKMVTDAAHANHIWVGVCGEMAGDVALVPLLLGLGMDELSASATLVPRVRMLGSSSEHDVFHFGSSCESPGHLNTPLNGSFAENACTPPHVRGWQVQWRS